jgi:putative Mg2+ transporter-C (MgtC) family protein
VPDTPVNGFFGLESSLTPIAHVAAALAAGGAIGLERTFHGRAAGFRTYALVCMGSAMAMLVATFPNAWLGAGANNPGDMTRVVQGILTGIGFLGAGVIVKYGFTVRGLTTAASIWTTAAIGVLIGARFYWEAAASVLLVLGALSLFRRIEDWLDKENFAQIKLGILRTPGLSKHDLDALFAQADLRIAEVAYGMEKNRSILDYEYTVSSLKPESLAVLADLLASRAEVISFHISPSHE